MQSSEFTASGVTIESILTNSKYRVPFFQRGYSWSKNEIGQFWEDITAIGKPSGGSSLGDSYFIGAMVFEYNETDERVCIIDGQQRLATVTILLSAIRDHLHDLDEEQRAKHVHELIAKGDWHLKEDYILVLGENDARFLQEFVQKWPPQDLEEKLKIWKKMEKKGRKGHSNKLILDAYRAYYTNIQNELAPRTETERVDLLIELADIITKKLKTVAISVGSDADAFIVFETLNDRGIELSVVDLFKNHVFSEAQKQSESHLTAVRRSWDTVSRTLGERNIKRYLRHYWISKFNHVRKKELYGAIRRYTKQAPIAEFVRDVEEEAIAYKKLVKPNEGDWKHRYIYESLAALDSMGVKQCYPLLLAGKATLSEKDFKTLCSLVERLSFRYSTICRRNPNRLEREYSKAALELRKTGEKRFTAVLKDLVSIAPDDRDFERCFLGRDFTVTNKVAAYILRKIEMSFKNDSPWVVAGTSKVHVEHIMPRKPNTQWLSVIESSNMDHSRQVKRLGNVTLLADKKNRQLSNKSFSVKVKNYKDSDLVITSHIGGYKKWTQKEISDRQRWLFDQAKKIWPI